MRRAWAAAAILAGLAASGCSRDFGTSDTGYEGTWSRGNERVTSIVALYPVGDEWKFRWSKYSRDGKFRVTCDWNGRCVETLNGQKHAEIEFTVRMSPETRRLFVSAVERRLVPEFLELRYVDELVVEENGLVLRANTRERGEEKLYDRATPTRTFDKISDGVAFPPQSPR